MEEKMRLEDKMRWRRERRWHLPSVAEEAANGDSRRMIGGMAALCREGGGERCAWDA